MTTLGSLQKLFRYDIDGDQPVGKGGCGHIWRAHDMLTGDNVALKTIAEALLWDSPVKARRTFKKEAIVAARLGEQSVHIARVFDIGIVDDILYYAMKWIDPEPGFSTIDIAERSGRMTLAQCKAILIDVCEAVSTAHEAGIIHSDIAPQNIVFDPASHNYLLADFGLLKVVEEAVVSKGSGSLLQGGRYHFFPPDVREDISKVSTASDVFALAVTLRVLIEGPSDSRSSALPTPNVIRIRHEQRDAPDQVRQLLTRFIDRHTKADSVDQFISMLQRVPA